MDSYAVQSTVLLIPCAHISSVLRTDQLWLSRKGGRQTEKVLGKEAALGEYATGGVRAEA